jgi:RimJ/RimL family protein N-acetyltransferase
MIVCQPLPDGTFHCKLPLWGQWEAPAATEYRARDVVEAHVIRWIALPLIRGAPLPPFGTLRTAILDVVVPDVCTARLRLVPCTATLMAMSEFDHDALAQKLDAQVHHDRSYPLVADDNAEPTDDETGPADNTPSIFDYLKVWWTMLDPVKATWKWLIIVRTNNVLIGQIGTTNPPDEGQVEEDGIQFSYSLVLAYQRRGYMSEAAHTYVAWAFSHPELTWLYAATKRTNTASRRILAKLGGHIFEEGEDIGWLKWAITRTNYDAMMLHASSDTAQRRS